MDSLITAAGIALQSGDPLGALSRIALREDAPALALRGIAMAQLGELAKARMLLRRAAQTFSPRERLERARCVTAEAEIALALRELRGSTRALDEARRAFRALHDHDNELHAALLQIRWMVLTGRISQAGTALAELDLSSAPAMLRARGELVAFEIALRRRRFTSARAALAGAQSAAGRSGIGALCAEVEHARQTLALPVARILAGDVTRPITIDEVEALLESPHLIVDACRRTVHRSDKEADLSRRPVLFALLRALAQAWPGEASREDLCEGAFRIKRINESHRARLRVELGRLRKALATLAQVRATPEGFTIDVGAGDIRLLLPPVDTPHTAMLALLADGEAWSASALALALGLSQRTVQRALNALLASSQVRVHGRGRARRWLCAPITGFATTLLLPSPPGIH